MQQHGGIGLSAFDPTLPFPTNIPDPLAYRPHYFQSGAMPTPSMNQGSNPSIPLNTATQQYPWNPINSFYSPLDSLGASSLSSRNLYSNNLMGLDQQNQYYNYTRNNQNTTPLYGAQVMGEL